MVRDVSGALQPSRMSKLEDNVATFESGGNALLFHPLIAGLVNQH